MMELIKKTNNLDVYIENDAKCAALAELWLGQAKEYKDEIVVVIGSGIGGAIVKGRKIHYGKNLHRGEFGYMLIKK
jgi:predicted NBD/HSP70 family sugar kinase